MPEPTARTAPRPGLDRPLRVLHLPTTVGRQAQGLARAERAVGLESRALSFDRHWPHYDYDEFLWDPRDGPLRRELKRLGVMRRALSHYDVLHFNFGRTILPMVAPPPQHPGALHQRLLRGLKQGICAALELRDLPLLSRAGKGIVFTFQGDDARQGDFLEANFEIHPAAEVEPGYYSPSFDARKRQRIRRIDRHAHEIFALNPDLLHVLPERARFLPYASVDPSEWQPVAPRETGPLRVLHAPSHRGIKGTRFVLEAIERLQAAGIAIELQLVENTTHAEALALYPRADVLVDQLLCGWFGGLAIELMALGKPVICYLREGDLDGIPQAMRSDLPIINADPRSLESVLRELATTRRAQLPELGARSRSFVERWFDPRAIAQKMVSVYRGCLDRSR